MGWQDWEFPSETKRREEHDEWLRQRLTPPSLERWGRPAVLARQGDAQTGGAFPCDHDIANPVQRGRATWLCRDCGADISLHYLFYMDAVARLEAQCG